MTDLIETTLTQDETDQLVDLLMDEVDEITRRLNSKREHEVVRAALANQKKSFLSILAKMQGDVPSDHEMDSLLDEEFAAEKAKRTAL